MAHTAVCIQQCAVREMSRALQALGALLAAEPSGKQVSYESCLSSMQETKDLAGDLETITIEQASAVSTELQDQWKQSSNKLYVFNCALAQLPAVRGSQPGACCAGLCAHCKQLGMYWLASLSQQTYQVNLPAVHRPGLRKVWCLRCI